MDSMLLDMVLAQSSSSLDPSTSALVSTLRSGSDVERAAAVQGALDRFSATNPTAKLLVQYLSRHQEIASNGEPAEPRIVELAPKQEFNPHAESANEQTEALNELRSQTENMLAELEVLRKRNDNLAWALGACPLCWGEQAECRACEGRGAPGFSLPDQKRFVEFVLPAVRLLQTRKSASNHFSAHAKPQSTGFCTTPIDNKKTTNTSTGENV